MMDRTITQCGRQELQGHLLQPICDVDIIEELVNHISNFLLTKLSMQPL